MPFTHVYKYQVEICKFYCSVDIKSISILLFYSRIVLLHSNIDFPSKIKEFVGNRYFKSGVLRHFRVDVLGLLRGGNDV